MSFSRFVQAHPPNAPHTLLRQHWKNLFAHYSESHRHYHTYAHIETLLDLREKYATLFQKPNLVDIAIFYHDAIYQPSRNDNEEASVVLAQKDLEIMNFSSNDCATVNALIIATKTHERGNSNDIALFTDMDLSILGADVNTYDDYAAEIRQEYIIYPDDIYKPGRKNVLQHFLNKPSIYHTDLFYQQFEQRARKNLNRELQKISESTPL